MSRQGCCLAASLASRLCSNNNSPLQSPCCRWVSHRLIVLPSICNTAEEQLELGRFGCVSSYNYYFVDEFIPVLFYSNDKSYSRPLNRSVSIERPGEHADKRHNISMLLNLCLSSIQNAAFTLFYYLSDPLCPVETWKVLLSLWYNFLFLFQLRKCQDAPWTPWVSVCLQPPRRGRPTQWVSFLLLLSSTYCGLLSAYSFICCTDSLAADFPSNYSSRYSVV